MPWIDNSKKTTVKKNNKSNKKLSFSKKTIEDINKWIKKYKKIIAVAKDKGLNESDTSNIILDMLWEILWYDKFFEITSEYRIKWQYCDYGVKINNKLEFLIEVKSIWIDLNENHIFQAVSYAWNEWVKRVVLTNLREWRIYHLSFGSKIEQELFVNINLIDNSKTNRSWDDLKFLHKESLIKGYLETLRGQRIAWSARNIKNIILSKTVLWKIRQELKKLTWINISEIEIQEAVESIIK